MRATASGSGSACTPLSQAASSAFRNDLSLPRVAAVAAPRNTAFSDRMIVVKAKAANSAGLIDEMGIALVPQGFDGHCCSAAARGLGLLRWKLFNVSQRETEPAFEVAVRSDPRQLHQDKPRHASS